MTDQKEINLLTQSARLRGLVILILSGILELAGIAAIVWGFALITPIAGWIVGGLALILIGLMVDPPKIRPKAVETE